MVYVCLNPSNLRLSCLVHVSIYSHFLLISPVLTLPPLQSQSLIRSQQGVITDKHFTFDPHVSALCQRSFFIFTPWGAVYVPFIQRTRLHPQQVQRFYPTLTTPTHSFLVVQFPTQQNSNAFETPLSRLFWTHNNFAIPSSCSSTCNGYIRINY